MPIMPISPYLVNKLFLLKAILQIVAKQSRPPKPQINAFILQKNINAALGHAAEANFRIQHRTSI